MQQLSYDSTKTNDRVYHYSSFKKVEFRIPVYNISFELAIKSLLKLSEKALCTFMYRFIFSLSISQLSILKSYVTLRDKESS